jgi:hypothetical protein
VSGKQTQSTPPTTQITAKTHRGQSESCPATAPESHFAELLTRCNVPIQFHAAFAVFIETGNATDEFLHFLDHEAHWQLALEQAFALHVGRLQDGLRILGRQKRPI